MGAGYGEASSFPRTTLISYVSRLRVLFHTVAVDLPCLVLDHFAQLWPFGEVFEVEPDVVCLGEMVEITWIEGQ